MNYKIIKLYQHIQEDPTLLNLEEKLIVNYIWSFQVNSKCCFASDDYLAGMLATTALETRGLINGLANRGKVKITHAPGTTTRMLSIPNTGEPDPCVQEIDIFGDVEF